MSFKYSSKPTSKRQSKALSLEQAQRKVQSDIRAHGEHEVYEAVFGGGVKKGGVDVTTLLVNALVDAQSDDDEFDDRDEPMEINGYDSDDSIFEVDERRFAGLRKHESNATYHSDKHVMKDVKHKREVAKRETWINNKYEDAILKIAAGQSKKMRMIIDWRRLNKNDCFPCALNFVQNESSFNMGRLIDFLRPTVSNAISLIMESRFTPGQVRDLKNRLIKIIIDSKIPVSKANVNFYLNRGNYTSVITNLEAFRPGCFDKNLIIQDSTQLQPIILIPMFKNHEHRVPTHAVDYKPVLGANSNALKVYKRKHAIITPIVANHALVSQLNGANGEVTGSDDVNNSCKFFNQLIKVGCRYVVLIIYQGVPLIKMLAAFFFLLMCWVGSRAWFPRSYHKYIDSLCIFCIMIDIAVFLQVDSMHKELDLLCSMPLLDCDFTADPDVASSINGSNGEFTGSDDVDNPAGGNNIIANRAWRARARQHHAGHGGGRRPGHWVDRGMHPLERIPAAVNVGYQGEGNVRVVPNPETVDEVFEPIRPPDEVIVERMVWDGFPLFNDPVADPVFGVPADLLNGGDAPMHPPVNIQPNRADRENMMEEALPHIMAQLMPAGPPPREEPKDMWASVENRWVYIQELDNITVSSLLTIFKCLFFFTLWIDQGEHMRFFLSSMFYLYGRVLGGYERTPMYDLNEYTDYESDELYFCNYYQRQAVEISLDLKSYLLKKHGSARNTSYLMGSLEFTCYDGTFSVVTEADNDLMHNTCRHVYNYVAFRDYRRRLTSSESSRPVRRLNGTLSQ